MSEEVRREVAESLAQSCFSQKQDPAGSKQAPYGFLFVLVVALTSCPASLWYWGKLSAASPCFLHITFCSSLVYLLSLMKVNFSAYTPWWWGDPVWARLCSLVLVTLSGCDAGHFLGLPGFLHPSKLLKYTFFGFHCHQII